MHEPASRVAASCGPNTRQPGAGAKPIQTEFTAGAGPRSPSGDNFGAGHGSEARTFTANWLDWAVFADAETVLSDDTIYGYASPKARQEWRWVGLAQRLYWHHGAAETLRRLNAGAAA